MSTHGPSPTLVIMAAGMASRYGSLKQLEPLGPHGETLLDYSVEFAAAAGFDRVVFIIRQAFEAEFRQVILTRYQNRPGLRLELAYQDLADLPGGLTAPAERTKPWGTVQAVLAARTLLNTPFAVLNADDYYGQPAFFAAARFLNQAAQGQTPTHAVVGYPLIRTLSEHGAVTRALCQTNAAGELTDITEIQRLQPEGGRVLDLDTGAEVPDQATVSMNFWAFGPDIIPLFQAEFEAFLRVGALTDPKAELPLPTAVKALRAAGLARFQVLTTDSPWFGITYPQDKPGVQARLAELHP